MIIQKVIIKNYKVFKDRLVEFNADLNIIVGDNECGKSTLLEAINLALTGQILGRYIQYDLNYFLFNKEIIEQFLLDLKQGNKQEPPKTLIEIYFDNDPQLTRLRGSNNSLREDAAGISLSIEFDEAYKDEYAEYTKEPDKIKSIPVEYYGVKWNSFAYQSLNIRAIPCKPTLVDVSTIRQNTGTNKYILDIINDCLTSEQQVQIALAHRKNLDSFLDEPNVKSINDNLSSKKEISGKTLSISLDTTSDWQKELKPLLDGIPVSQIGKGEQSSIKIKLALENALGAHIILLEEPENHLSFSNLNKLIKNISDQSKGKQLIIATHDNFVLNKLGIDNVLLFGKNKNSTLKKLDKETYEYFMKLPGYDTLRLILAQKAILVEGPSDELIVQKAFLKKFNCMPLDKGVDVICINSLSFKRFLEIAVLLDIEVTVVTDNDGNVAKVKEKFKNYEAKHIKICYDLDENFATLEPQLLKVNNLKILNDILGKNFKTDNDILSYMRNNKTDCALKFFNSNIDFKFPKYIDEAISE